MTHHDKARELVEQLRQWDGCWPAPGLERDVEAVADLITALAEENRRLRGVLEKIASTGRCEFAEVRAVLRSTEASHD
ncbi:hypothetical protein ACDP63_18170 [Paracoccus sp. P2]|uniref:hypothetical protein n=1 Tax=Paracoccus sp. P2 TaxID=3248840 RepID=UPI00391F2D9A